MGGALKSITRYLTIGATILFVLFLVWFFSSIVWYIICSIIISLVGKPLVRLLQRIRVGRWQVSASLAAGVTLITFIGLTSLFFYGLFPLLASQFEELKTVDPAVLLSNFSAPLEMVQEQLEVFLPEGMEDFSLRGEIRSQLMGFFDASFFSNFFSSTASFLTNLFIALFSICFISFFFLREEGLSVEAITMFFPEKYEENIRHAMTEVMSLLQRYFLGIFIESVVITVLTCIGILLIKLPLNTSVVIGLLAGILNVIPYVGAIIALIIALIIVTAMYASAGLSMSLGTLVLLVCAIFLIARLIDNFFLQPYIYAGSVNALPLEIFIILLMAGQIAGVLGMLLAIPAYTVIRVFAKEFFNKFHIVQRLTRNV
ncbi:MAG: AI-2E family transporter [Bacteroidetes bacterium]|nr:MAG: AI-2E family transporter [Bacteroidota bacterium]